MAQELKNIITNEKELRITSVELVDVINQFRKEEGRKELKHYDFYKKIKKELKTLELLGLGDNGNISEIEYTDERNRKQPCFSLNRDGMLQMLNSESTLVRYKTIEYINELEKENKQLEEDLVEVSKIAISDKEQKQREYETKKTLYSWRNIRTVLMACDYKNLEDTVTDVINFHVNVLKKNDRVYGYSNLDKTSYKQAVRDRVYNILDCVYNNTKDGVLRTVAGEVKETLIKDKIATINRSNGHVISGLQKELESLKPTPLEDMVCINYHAFSYDNSAIDKDGHWKPAYRTWIQNFPMEDIPSINYWLDRGVDFNKPVKIIIKCVNKKEFDTTNLVKAIQDVLFNKERGKYRADDNFIRAGEIETIDFCDDYSDGKMYIDLENIDNCNIIDTNMDANMNEQLHNQEFAEFVSNLFGDF